MCCEACKGYRLGPKGQCLDPLLIISLFHYLCGGSYEILHSLCGVQGLDFNTSQKLVDFHFGYDRFRLSIHLGHWHVIHDQPTPIDTTVTHSN